MYILESRSVLANYFTYSFRCTQSISTLVTDQLHAAAICRDMVQQSLVWKPHTALTSLRHPLLFLSFLCHPYILTINFFQKFFFLFLHLQVTCSPTFPGVVALHSCSHLVSLYTSVELITSSLQLVITYYCQSGPHSANNEMVHTVLLYTYNYMCYLLSCKYRFLATKGMYIHS